MNIRSTILAGLLALGATAANADAQGLRLGYHKSFGSHGHGSHGHGSHGYGSKGHASVSISFGNPYASKRACYPAPRRVWVPGHYQKVERRVWVEGGYHRQWVPAVYDTRFDACGRRSVVQVRAGYWLSVPTPGRFETHPVDVWVDGHWTVR